MQETKDPKRDQSSVSDSASSGKHNDEATSSETLHDIEGSEKVPSGKSRSNESGEGSGGGNPPSPDGQFDNSSGGGSADGRDTGGPM